MVKVKQSRAVIVIVFAVSLLLPGLLLSRDTDRINHLENRSVWPSPGFLSEGGGLNRNFVAQFQRYWDDNIAFKELAITINLMVKYHLFGKFYGPHFYHGKDGHLFFDVDGSSIRNYQRLNPVSEEEQNEALQNLIFLNDYFERRAIPFFMVLIPDKERVYPEYYPDHIVQQNKDGLPDLEAIVAYARRNSGLNIVSLTDALVRGKNSDFYLYPIVEPSHWNMKGAFIGYQEIMKLLRSVYPDLLILEEDDFTITTRSTVKQIGPDIKFNNMVYVIYDFEYDYSSIRSTEPLTQSESFLKAIHGFPNFYYINPLKPEAPRLLVHGDSYIYAYMLPMLAESFSELFFINVINTINIHDPSFTARALHESAKAFSPDIVLLAMVERGYSFVRPFTHYRDLAAWQE